MRISRREFLKASAAAGTVWGMTASGLLRLQKVLAAEGGPLVVWLQGQSCSGCSVSLLNSIYYTTIDDLLINTLDLEFHPTVMAAAGDLAVSAAEAANAAGGYVLVVEGAIPTAENGDYCHIWPGTTILDAVQSFSQNAGYVLAVGGCAAFGGVPGGSPNPTGASGVRDILGSPANLINIPGCPAHPDWIVGTISYLLANGRAPRLDSEGRPKLFFDKTVHSRCERKAKFCGERPKAPGLSQPGCLKELGCKGPDSKADCPVRQWNSGGAGRMGVNWCVGAGAPCHGCTEPGFPDAMSPFYKDLN